MLKGYYISEKGIRINLIGYDFDSYISFLGTCPTSKDFVNIDKGVLFEEGRKYSTWNELYIQVNSGDIKVDDITVDGVQVEFNAEFFSRLGSIVRGMKSICIPQREEDFYNLSSNAEFGSKGMYNYEYFGQKISLIENQIERLEYRNGEEVLFLEDVYSDPVPMSKNTRKQRKFALVLDEFSRVDDLQVSGMEDFLSQNNVSSDDVYSLAEIIERNPDKSYVWLKDRKYNIVNDLEVFKPIAKRIYKHPLEVGFDTETTGLDITFKSITGQGSQLVGLIFTIKPTKAEQEKIKNLGLENDILYADAWYIPMAHKNIDNIVEEGDIGAFMEMYIKPILEQKMIVCHNGSFDSKVMFIYGIKLNLMHDTMILLRLSYGAENTSMRLGLKPNSKRFLGRDSFELSDFVEGKWGSGNVTFADLPYESVMYYACPDTDNMMELLELAKRENWWDRWGMRRVYELEVQFSRVVAYQEFYGHHVAVHKIAKLRKQLEEDVEKYSSLIFGIAGYTLNLRSAPQLKKLLFEDLGMPVVEYTESGAPSTSKDALKKFKSMTKEDGSPKYPIADYILKYRDASKLMSDFIKNIDTISTPDGFMFSSVKQFLETGRVSVSNPNYQSYNDTVKKYISPRKGYYMMDSDYSSVEIRIMMSMAQEQAMIDYLYNPDSDYHTLKASQMFSIPYELVSKTQRGAAKGVNFGIVYGMGDASLGENVTGVRSAESTNYGAKLRKLYFKGMDVTEGFIAQNLEKAVANRYAETYFGRRRYFPPNMRIGSVKRQGGNHPIQGTAADLYKQAMVNLYANIIERDWWGKFLLPCFVHDEIVMEAHNSINPAVAMKLVRESLMLDLEGWCPLYIGFGFGSHWYNAKKTEIPVQLQQEIIDTYGKKGFPFWAGNIHELYEWEVRQIYDYKVRRIRQYLEDEENHNKVISPVISAFLFEVMPYVKSLDKLKGVVNSLREIDNTEEYIEENIRTIIPTYFKLDKCGVHLDKFLEPHSVFMDEFEMKWNDYYKYVESGGLDYLDKYITFEEAEKFVEIAISVAEGIANYEFLTGLATTDVEIGGIAKSLEAFGKAFSLEELVATANLQEPGAVEAKEVEVKEEYTPELEEEDKEVVMAEYIKGFGYYRDYEERVLYISGANDGLLSYMLNFLLQNGGLSKRNGEDYTNAKTSYNEGSTDYMAVRFVLADGTVHPTVLYLPSKQASRVCSMTVQVKSQMGV